MLQILFNFWDFSIKIQPIFFSLSMVNHTTENCSIWKILMKMWQHIISIKTPFWEIRLCTFNCKHLLFAGVPQAMQKLMFKGMMKDDKTLRELKVANNAKLMLVGSTITDVLEVTKPVPKAQLEKEAQGEIYVLRSSGISRKSGADVFRKRNEFVLFSIVLRFLQLLINSEPLVQFRWGFSAKCTSPNEHFNQIENWKCYMFDFRLMSLDRITYMYTYLLTTLHSDTTFDWFSSWNAHLFVI